MSGTISYLVGAAAGLAWGGAAALLNSYIGRKFIEKNDPGAMSGFTLARSAVDIAALAAVFLVRKLLPFSYEAALIAAAAAMSVLTIIFTYRLSRGK